MFDKDPDVQVMINTLWEKFGPCDRGLVIEWRSLEGISGSRYTHRGKYIIDEFRKRLLTVRGVATRAVRGVGVRLLMPESQNTECPYERQQRAYRQCNKGLVEVKAIDQSELSTHHRALRATNIHNLQRIRLACYRGKKDNRIFIKTYTAPRLKPKRKSE